MSDQSIEQEIVSKGLTAPRITVADIEALMKKVTVRTAVFEGTTTTVAVAFDENGFSLATKISACASSENFDAELGAKIATSGVLAAAREKLWELEGYRLKCLLAEKAYLGN